MEETAWDTALAPHPAGCCKDRAAARPDPCNGRGVGHLLRGPAGSGAIGTGPAVEGPGVAGGTLNATTTNASINLRFWKTLLQIAQKAQEFCY